MIRFVGGLPLGIVIVGAAPAAAVTVGSEPPPLDTGCPVAAAVPAKSLIMSTTNTSVSVPLMPACESPLVPKPSLGGMTASTRLPIFCPIRARLQAGQQRAGEQRGLAAGLERALQQLVRGAAPQVDGVVADERVGAAERRPAAVDQRLHSELAAGLLRGDGHGRGLAEGTAHGHGRGGRGGAGGAAASGQHPDGQQREGGKYRDTSHWKETLSSSAVSSSAEAPPAYRAERPRRPRTGSGPVTARNYGRTYATAPAGRLRPAALPAGGEFTCRRSASPPARRWTGTGPCTAPSAGPGRSA